MNDRARYAAAFLVFVFLLIPLSAGAGGVWDIDPDSVLNGRPIERLRGMADRVVDRVLDETLRKLYTRTRAASRPLPPGLLKTVERHWPYITDRPLHHDARMLVSPDLLDVLSGFGIFGGRKEGVVFYDVLVLRDHLQHTAESIGYLAHELIHVAQFREIGLDRFLIEYAAGWAGAGGDYRENPFEKEAFDAHVAILERLKTAGAK